MHTTGSTDTGAATKRPDQLSEYGAILDKAIRSAASSLIAASKNLDELDSKVRHMCIAQPQTQVHMCLGGPIPRLCWLMTATHQHNLT